MTISELAAQTGFQVLSEGEAPDTQISGVFCCDLLSVCMSHLNAANAWVTVMGNVNAVAVAVLTEAACIILAENTPLDDAALEKAKQQGVAVFRTELPIFEAAKRIDSLNTL